MVNVTKYLKKIVITFVLVTGVVCIIGTGGGGDNDTENKVWIHPSDLNDNISPDGENANYPQVAMDDNGNAVITWHQGDGNYQRIFKSEYPVRKSIFSTFVVVRW